MCPSGTRRGGARGRPIAAAAHAVAAAAVSGPRPLPQVPPPPGPAERGPPRARRDPLLQLPVSRFCAFRGATLGRLPALKLGGASLHKGAWCAPLALQRPATGRREQQWSRLASPRPPPPPPPCAHLTPTSLPRAFAAAGALTGRGPARASPRWATPRRTPRPPRRRVPASKCSPPRWARPRILFLLGSAPSAPGVDPGAWWRSEAATHPSAAPLGGCGAGRSHRCRRLPCSRSVRWQQAPSKRPTAHGPAFALALHAAGQGHAAVRVAGERTGSGGRGVGQAGGCQRRLLAGQALPWRLPARGCRTPQRVQPFLRTLQLPALFARALGRPPPQAFTQSVWAPHAPTSDPLHPPPPPPPPAPPPPPPPPPPHPTPPLCGPPSPLLCTSTHPGVHRPPKDPDARENAVGPSRVQRDRRARGLAHVAGAGRPGTRAWGISKRSWRAALCDGNPGPTSPPPPLSPSLSPP
jgi:hypothetical protein